VSWALLGGAGVVPGTLGATMLVAACASVFALGETLLQPTMPAMTNDLTTDRLRGRTNALTSGAFQLPMVLAPPVSGWLIGHHLEGTYVALLVIGCVLVAVVAVVQLEPRITPAANGINIPPETDGPAPTPGPAVQHADV
jgi:MFS family permease